MLDLETFKAGQKAVTRDGREATYIGICENCLGDEALVFTVPGRSNDVIITTTLTGSYHSYNEESLLDLVEMVSRH
jgi:hypothetical protein